MRFVFLIMVTAFPLFSSAQSIMDILKRSGELYDEGTKYFTQKEYMIADSLFGESLKIYPHPDTYYNRAIARKNIGDQSGFAQNLEHAMELGDTTARKIYYKQCVVADTFYLSKDNKKASVFDFHRCLIFRKSKYTSYQEVQRFDPSEEVDLKYVVKNRDTVYYTIPNTDSIALKSEHFIQSLRKNLKYPVELRDKGISGMVLMNFTVSKNGDISDIVAVHSNALAFSAESIMAIQKIGKFPVIRYEGKPVNMKLTIPVVFTVDRHPKQK